MDGNCDGETDENCDEPCENGARQNCATECGQGDQVCRSGAWDECSAAAPSDEICDGVDNDCDGEVDEGLVRDCSTVCGVGTQICCDGSWGACDAPDECLCAGENERDTQTCGVCGTRARSCADGSWRGWGECQEQGCVPGEVESQVCGRCGESVRHCTYQCSWGPWRRCGAQGPCEPGATQEGSCGTCGGTSVQVCSESCEWETLSCQVPPGEDCAPGDREDRTCRTDGIQFRNCQDDCTWGAWGRCLI